ncbi:MAG: ParB/RepB/Spo0J family partition protein [Deltaproteobacteria bacterium]|nr:ParB/RepB/Spo0J family partition protein [Deltaproteobacteria bacterium]TLN00754.1 MAG: ParB/RepB/Spo0J family partition protein [bacterium]
MHDSGDIKNETVSQMQLFEVEPASTEKVSSKTGKDRKTSYRQGNLYDVAINEIALNSEQPRRFFDETELKALAESICANGLLQPVLCQSKENRLYLLAGERRLRAAGLAGLEKIPVRIVSGDPLEIALIENLLRSDLTAIEEAEAIAALKEKKGFRLEDLAGITGKAVPTLSEILSLTRLPEEILTKCRTMRAVPRDILVLIGRLPGEEDQVAAFEQYLQGALTRESLAARSRRAKTVQLKKSAPFNYIRGVAKRFSRFDLGKLNSGEKEKIRGELEKLMHSIAQTLENLE